MTITLADVTPIGLCISTQDLFDAKRFQSNFCDNIILRAKDPMMSPKLTALKRDLASVMTEKKFLDGHKTAIISNIDKILGIATSRFSKDESKMVEQLVMNGKGMIKRIIRANNFEDILAMEGEFKSKITLPVYELFIKSLKRSRINVI